MKILTALKDELKDFFSRRVTEGYPYEEADIQEEYRGEHLHDKEKCIYCGKCAEVCPATAIRVDKEEESWEVDLGRCMFCGRCEDVCPVDAISFSNNFKMADKDKKNLIKEGKSD